jgi:hypothetical protein
MPKTNTCPVIMYPEGVIVGKVKSGRQTAGGKIRHVATDSKNVRVGTFDTFREAQAVLELKARESLENDLQTCELCGGEYTEDESGAVEPTSYCSGDCEHSMECTTSDCGYPFEHGGY